MKLAAIYNCWDGLELLYGSMESIKSHVDVIIIVYQKESNFGEFNEEIEYTLRCLAPYTKFKLVEYFPIKAIGGSMNEAAKRNIGIDCALELDCTHFFHIDVDEYYEDFGAAKQAYIDSGAFGSVCPIYTYFKKPTYRLAELDNYYVPFIHKLQPSTKAGSSSYHFWVDPTRTINIPQGESMTLLSDHPMHHYSWVRDDIQKKVRNSSAGQHGNKLKGLLADYYSPELKEGYVIADMGSQKIIEVPNLFNIKTGL